MNYFMDWTPLISSFKILASLRKDYIDRLVSKFDTIPELTYLLGIEVVILNNIFALLIKLARIFPLSLI